MGNSGSRSAREPQPQPYRGDAAPTGAAPPGAYGAPPVGPPPPMYAAGGAPPGGYNPYAAGPYGGGPMMYPMPPFSTPELLQAALFSGMPPQMFLHGGAMGGMPAPPMPPPRVEHATTIRNDVNLKKASLRLLRDRRDPGRLALEFQFDANVPCAVTVFFAHRSDESASLAAGGGAGESSLLARLQPFRASHPGVRTLFRKGLGQTYSQAVLMGHAAEAGRGVPGSFVVAPPLPSSSGGSSSASSAIVDGSSFAVAPAGFAGEYLDLRAFNEEELTNAPASGDGRGQPSSVLASPRAGAGGAAASVSPADAARYGALPPHLFPVVVVLQTVPEGDPDHAAASSAPAHGLVVPAPPGTFGGRGGPAAGPAPGSAASRVGLQATYATLLHRTSEEGKDQAPAPAPSDGASSSPQQWLPSVAWVAKPMRQRIQVGGTEYELKEIYGMDGSSAAGGGAAAADGDRDASGGASAAAGGAGADDGLLAGAECVVCLTDRRDTAVLPCRHMCLCYDCAQQLRLSTNKCPICRTGESDRDGASCYDRLAV